MPSFQNIITTASQGDSLKNAFDKVNANFKLITDGEFVIVSSAQVNSVAGRQGDIALTVNDIAGAASIGFVNDKFQDAIQSIVTQNELDSAVQTAINIVLDGAPAALDTLSEIATALNNDTDFAGTLTGQLSVLSNTVASNLQSTNSQILLINQHLSSGNIVTSGNISGLAITASAGFNGNLVGNVTGNSAGTHTGAVIGNVTGQVSDISNHTTSSLVEGTRLYYTDERVGSYLTTNSYATEAYVGTEISTASGNYATAAQGAKADSALQSVSFADLTSTPTTLLGYGITDSFFDGEYSSLTNTPTLGTASAENVEYFATAAQGAKADSAIQSLTGYATELFVGQAISTLVESSPETLDTLNELAAALGDDPNFATTTATAIGLKANTADLATIATTGEYADLLNTPTIPVDVSDLTDTTNLLDHFSGAYADLTGAPTIPADVSDLTDTTNLLDHFSGAYADLTGAPTLATVATSGDYTDLINKPSADTGNFTFTSNTLGVADVNGGITINANGNGEIVLSDNVGINNTNPGAWLHIGNSGDLTQTGMQVVSYGDTNFTNTFPEPDLADREPGTYLVSLGGDALLGWQWGDGDTIGNTPSRDHARFGIFNQSLSSPWITFSELAPANVLEIDHKGRFKHTAIQGGALAAWAGSNFGDTLFKSDEPLGSRFYSTGIMSVREASANPTDNWTEIGNSFLTQYTTDSPGDATTISRRDRIRGLANGAELKLFGETWESNDYAPAFAGSSGSFKLLGRGKVGHLVGTTSYAQLYATEGTNGNLDVNTYNNRGSITAFNGYTALDASDVDAGNVTADYASVITGSVSAYENGSNTITVNNAVGLYLPHYTGYTWVRGMSVIGNKYSVLSEDPDTVLSHAGNIEITGSSSKLVVYGQEVTDTKITAWDQAVLWGDHSTVGYASAASVPTDLNQLADASGLLDAYTPTTPTDWAGTPPTTIGEAIDRLATLMKTLNSGTGA